VDIGKITTISGETVTSSSRRGNTVQQKADVRCMQKITIIFFVRRLKQRNLRKISKKELKTVLMTFENPSHNGRVSFGASITYALFA
jgi:ornithine carbamoyltransferase